LHASSDFKNGAETRRRLECPPSSIEDGGGTPGRDHAPLQGIEMPDPSQKTTSRPVGSEKGIHVFFVCSGNISRSFLAEALFRVEVKGCPGLNVSIRSAGLRAFPGNLPDPEMVHFLMERGLPVPDHRARLVSREDVAWAHRILVMEWEHLRAMERFFPDADGKTELLGAYNVGKSLSDEIADPFGLSSRHYRLAQSRISLAVKGLRRVLEESAVERVMC